MEKLKKRNCIPCEALIEDGDDFKCEFDFAIYTAYKEIKCLDGDVYKSSVPCPKGRCPRPLSEKTYLKHGYLHWKKTQENLEKEAESKKSDQNG